MYPIPDEKEEFNDHGSIELNSRGRYDGKKREKRSRSNARNSNHQTLKPLSVNTRGGMPNDGDKLDNSEFPSLVSQQDGKAFHELSSFNRKYGGGSSKHSPSRVKIASRGLMNDDDFESHKDQISRNGSNFKSPQMA